MLSVAHLLASVEQTRLLIVLFVEQSKPVYSRPSLHSRICFHSCFFEILFYMPCLHTLLDAFTQMWVFSGNYACFHILIYYLKTLLDTLNSRVRLKRMAAGTVEETGEVMFTSFIETGDVRIISFITFQTADKFKTSFFFQVNDSFRMENQSNTFASFLSSHPGVQVGKKSGNISVQQSLGYPIQSWKADEDEVYDLFIYFARVLLISKATHESREIIITMKNIKDWYTQGLMDIGIKDLKTRSSVEKRSYYS